MRKSKISPYFLKNLRNLGEIPNVPYLYKIAKKEIEKRLQEIGFTRYHSRFHKKKEGCFFASDELATYAKIRRGKPNFSLIISSHLDHPGFAIKNSKEGIALGSIGITRLKKYIEKENIPLKIYGPNGKLITTNAFITEISKEETKPIIFLKTKDKIPSNSYGIFNLPFICIEEEKIKMLTADNVACSAAILQCLKNVIEERNQFKNVDLTVVFSYIEEIKQISMTGIAKRKKTPFEDLKKEMIYIALEAMESEIDDNQKEILKKFALPKPNYESGVLIKITDSNLVFGQGYLEKNLAEELLLSACKKNNINYQHTISSGTSEGTALSLFNISSNIATLVIPNRHKHNLGDEGEIVSEEIKISDLIDAIKILSTAIKISDEKKPIEEHGLAERLKKTNLSAPPKKLKAMKKEREILLTASLPRLRLACFYPNSTKEKIIIDFHRSLAKIQSLIA